LDDFLGEAGVFSLAFLSLGLAETFLLDVRVDFFFSFVWTVGTSDSASSGSIATENFCLPFDRLGDTFDPEAWDFKFGTDSSSDDIGSGGGDRSLRVFFLDFLFSEARPSSVSASELVRVPFPFCDGPDFLLGALDGTTTASSSESSPTVDFF
jgi:hypothetical protein